MSHSQFFTSSFVAAAEFVRLADLPLLEDLVFVGNPLEEKYSADQQSNWVEEATKRVPRLKKLDGELWVASGQLIRKFISLIYCKH